MLKWLFADSKRSYNPKTRWVPRLPFTLALLPLLKHPINYLAFMTPTRIEIPGVTSYRSPTLYMYLTHLSTQWDNPQAKYRIMLTIHNQGFITSSPHLNCQPFPGTSCCGKHFGSRSSLQSIPTPRLPTYKSLHTWKLSYMTRQRDAFQDYH